MKKPGRNDPCPCGSGKKFKKCCESQMLGGRFKATKVESESAPLIQKVAGLSSLFQERLAETPKKPPSFSEEPKNFPSESSLEKPLSDPKLEEKEDI